MIFAADLLVVAMKLGAPMALVVILGIGCVSVSGTLFCRPKRSRKFCTDLDLTKRRRGERGVSEPPEDDIFMGCYQSM